MFEARMKRQHEMWRSPVSSDEYARTRRRHRGETRFEFGTLRCQVDAGRVIEFQSVCAPAWLPSPLWVLGVRSGIVLALWVAFADLFPLVGATLGNDQRRGQRALAPPACRHFERGTVDLPAQVRRHDS
jgi:hypothetical protein